MAWTAGSEVSCLSACQSCAAPHAALACLRKRSQIVRYVSWAPCTRGAEEEEEGLYRRVMKQDLHLVLDEGVDYDRASVFGGCLHGVPCIGMKVLKL